MLNNAFELFFFPVVIIKVFQISEGESLCCSAFFTFLVLVPKNRGPGTPLVPLFDQDLHFF